MEKEKQIQIKTENNETPDKTMEDLSQANSPQKPSNENLIKVKGIRGWFDYRLWLVLSLHIVACVVLYQSPFYSDTDFHLFKLFWDLIFALLVMSTICWEWKLLGQINGPNLVGHFSFLLSLTFLFDRFFTRPMEIQPITFTGILGKMIGKTASVIIQSIGDFVNNILHLPIWLQEIFRSPLLMVLFILLCLILNMPRSKGIPALGILFIFYLISTIANPRSGIDPYFFSGIIFIFIAFILQYNDSFMLEFWKIIKMRLGDKDYNKNLAAKGAIIKAVSEDGQINDTRARSLVGQYFNLDENSASAYRETARVLKELVIRDAIFSSEITEKGFSFNINPNLLEKNDLWAKFPIYSRSVVIGAVALIWLLMPLDLLPDSIPVLGVVDDLLICATGGKIVYDAFGAGKNASGRQLPAPSKK